MDSGANRRGNRAGARSPKSLILGVADFAERKRVDAPRELEIWFDWQTFNTPYYPGGLADQPYALMRRIRVSRNVYEAIRAWRESKDWQRLQKEQPATWAIIEAVVQMRQVENG